MIEVKSLPVLIIEAIDDDDRERLAKLLLDNTDELRSHTFMAGQTWLGFAAREGKLEAAKELIRLGADVNAGDSHYGSKPICSAARGGHHRMAKYLLDAGSDLDVDASGRNPLFAAIVGRAPDIVALLLERGIDATVRYNSPTMRDMDAVAFALMRGEQECAEIIARWNAKGDERLAQQALAEADAVADKNAGIG